MDDYTVGDRVRIDTGNADGSIPSLPDYHATIKEVYSHRDAVFVHADDGDRFEIHKARLTKL